LNDSDRFLRILSLNPFNKQVLIEVHVRFDMLRKILTKKHTKQIRINMTDFYNWAQNTEPTYYPLTGRKLGIPP